MQPLVEAWDGLAHSLSSLLVVSSAASAFDLTDPQIHVLCGFTRVLTVSVNERLVFKNAASFPLLFNC